MRRTRPLAILLLVSCLPWLSGCGYTLAGTGPGILPPNVKTVYVETFVNDTTTVGLEQRLTDAVIRELSGRGRLKPVSDRNAADAELSGHLLSCSVYAVQFDSQGRGTEYQINVTARVKLVDRATEKVLFEDPALLFHEPYNVPVTSGSYFNQEQQAIEVLAQPFARSLVTAILEGF